MTRTTPDWLLELRNARGAGIDAIALFRRAESSVIVEAITGCEIRILPVGATLLQPGQSSDTIYVLLSGQLAAYLDDARCPEAGIPIQPGESVGEMSAIDGIPAEAACSRARSAGATDRAPVTNQYDSVAGSSFPRAL